MATTRKSKRRTHEPKWEWGIDEFDSREEVEGAILEAIFDQVLDDDDDELKDPLGAVYDVEITVNLVPRGSSC